jgi:hypothetical protein
MTDEEKFVLHDPELFVGDNALARRGEPLHVWGENTSATGLTEATEMTNEELVKRLRNFDDGATPTHEAADRIEQLQQALKDQSSVSDRLAEANEKMKEKFLVVMAERDEAWERAEHAEEQWGRCGVKLAKAVAALGRAKASIENGGGGGVTDVVWLDDPCPETLCDFIDATLAEIEGLSVKQTG